MDMIIKYKNTCSKNLCRNTILIVDITGMSENSDTVLENSNAKNLNFFLSLQNILHMYRVDSAINLISEGVFIRVDSKMPEISHVSFPK